MKRETSPIENLKESREPSINATDLLNYQPSIDSLLDVDKSYGVLAEAASDAIIRIDDRSIIEFVNSAATRVFGHPIEDMLGQPLTMLMPEELRERLRAGFERYLTMGERHLNWECIEIPRLKAASAVVTL